jgi:sensor histidine kinase YesM
MTFDYAMAYFLLGVMFLTSIFGIFISVFMPGINTLSRKYFASIFGNLTLMIIAWVIDVSTWRVPEFLTEEKIAIFIEAFCYSLMMPTFTIYLLRFCGESLRNKLFYSVSFFFLIYVILFGVAQVTEIFYYVTAEGFYCGEWFFLLKVPVNLTIFLNIFGVIRRKKILPKRYFWAFLVYLLTFSLGTLIHSIIFSEFVLGLGVIFSTLEMVAIIFSDYVNEFFKQQREIVNQQANILILQMRPHFIYNTMTSIYYLCSQNPEQAQKVTLDFTNYLRKNFTAIALSEMILFSEELEHARTYLSIEQVQFEDQLFVEYDTPHVNFKIPPLTLQPIVENSVKHGLDPDAEPLHILILTRETENGNVIIVEDNGVGFKFESIKENSALANIKKRLEMFCGGSLIIEPRAGGGTVVKIFVPMTQK